MTWAYALEAPPALGDEDLRLLLGGKAVSLVVMATVLGLPVPPGLVISTEACTAFRRGGWSPSLDRELRARMAGIERATGRRFGDPADPLLVSVRSGAPVSMPGMLDTVLNVGLNDETTRGLSSAAGDDAFAVACRLRLETMYHEVVGSTDVPADPWAQLRGAVEAVFRSWDGERASTYRAKEGIDDDLGTAVVVQAMVFGNRGPASATGVLFTRDPSTGEREPYGEVLFGAQGEDVVAGTHVTEPLAALDERLPAVAAELRRHADGLERHYADVCDIEFTVEEGRLWMLQSRIGARAPRAALRVAIEMADDPGFPLTREEAVHRVAAILADPPTVARQRRDHPEIVATGLAASPGLVSGVVATSPDAAVRMAEAGSRVLLVRSQTSPDDVRGMARSVGVLTSSGGVTSHAAVVARGWGIPAVVGVGDLVVGDGIVRIGARTWREGDEIGIDGSTGSVFGAAVAVDEDAAPEVATLLGWARELGIEIGWPSAADDGATGTAAGQAVDPASEPVAEVLTDDVIRALLIKGYATPETLGPSMGVTGALARERLDGLVVAGAAEIASGMYRLTDVGRAMAEEAIESDRASWGQDAASSALDGFLALDGRVKSIVTAWQMREVNGAQVLNDHTDGEYDSIVLADLAALHADVGAWFAPLISGPPRFAGYARRLDAAAAALSEGEHAFLVSPRVDSYHTVWFELHEDLIRLAGRTREQETAAGRA